MRFDGARVCAAWARKARIFLWLSGVVRIVSSEPSLLMRCGLSGSFHFSGATVVVMVSIHFGISAACQGATLCVRTSKFDLALLAQPKAEMTKAAATKAERKASVLFLSKKGAG